MHSTSNSLLINWVSSTQTLVPFIVPHAINRLQHSVCTFLDITVSYRPPEGPLNILRRNTLDTFRSFSAAVILTKGRPANMSSERILRLKRAEDTVHSFVLLHVVGGSSSPLGLKLTASDGEQTFCMTSKFLGLQDSFSFINIFFPSPLSPRAALTWHPVP
jgi:hypothetical protein